MKELADSVSDEVEIPEPLTAAQPTQRRLAGINIQESVAAAPRAVPEVCRKGKRKPSRRPNQNLPPTRVNVNQLC